MTQIDELEAATKELTERLKDTTDEFSIADVVGHTAQHMQDIDAWLLFQLNDPIYEQVGEKDRIVEWKLKHSANTFDLVFEAFPEPVYGTGRAIHRMLCAGYTEDGFDVEKFANGMVEWKESFVQNADAWLQQAIRLEEDGDTKPQEAIKGAIDFVQNEKEFRLKLESNKDSAFKEAYEQLIGPIIVPYAQIADGATYSMLLEEMKEQMQPSPTVNKTKNSSKTNELARQKKEKEKRRAKRKALKKRK